jgi:hypothetical protein
MRRQRIVFPPHFLDGCIHFAYSVAECREGILQAIGRIRSHEHNLAPKVKHRPLDAQTPQLLPTLSRGREIVALAYPSAFPPPIPRRTDCHEKNIAAPSKNSGPGRQPIDSSRILVVACLAHA